MENQVWQCMRCESYNPVNAVRCSICGEMRANAAVQFPAYRPAADDPTLSISDALTAASDDDPPEITGDRFSSDDVISQIRPDVNPDARKPFVPDATGIAEDPFVSDEMVRRVVPAVFQPRPEEEPRMIQQLMPIPAQKNDRVRPVPAPQPEPPEPSEPPEPPKRHFVLPVVLTLLAGTALAAGILFAAGFFGGTDQPAQKASSSSSAAESSEAVSTVSEPAVSGPDDGRIVMPDFVGSDYSFALSQARQLGLKPETVYRESDERKYRIISQSIQAGTRVPQGTAVKLYVSKGQPGETTATQTETTASQTQTETTTLTTVRTTQPAPLVSSRKDLYRNYFKSYCSMSDRVVTEDVTHDGEPEMIVVHDEGNSMYTAKVYTVKNGSVSKIFETSGGESHAAGFFNLYLYKGENDRYYSLGQEYFDMYQGIGTCGYRVFYLSEDGKKIPVASVSTDEARGSESQMITNEEMSYYRDLLRGYMVYSYTIISFYTESDIRPGEIESDPRTVLGLP